MGTTPSGSASTTDMGRGCARDAGTASGAASIASPAIDGFAAETPAIGRRSARGTNTCGGSARGTSVATAPVTSPPSGTRTGGVTGTAGTTRTTPTTADGTGTEARPPAPALRVRGQLLDERAGAVHLLERLQDAAGVNRYRAPLGIVEVV